MNIFDFDKTIYKKDSSFAFYRFCLKKHFSIIRYAFIQLWALGMYLLGFWDITKAKEKFFSYFKALKDIDSLVNEFWKKETPNLNSQVLEKINENDVVVSAGPEFLIRPITDKLGVKLIASNVDKKTGKFNGKNNSGEEKIERLKALDITHAENAYSDKLGDLPMLKLADNAFIVTKKDIVPLEDYKPSFMKKVFDYFFSVEFFQFLVVGVINTINSTLISTLFSLWLQANVAFIIGYILSLSIAYVLNSVWIFKQKLTFKKFVMFAVSYIPNFIIQNVIVFLLFNLAGLNKILVYALAAIIGIPVTFICVKLLCFLKKKPKETQKSE